MSVTYSICKFQTLRDGELFEPSVNLASYLNNKIANLLGKQHTTSTVYYFISFNNQTRFSLFILSDEIRSNNYQRNTLSGESILRRFVVSVDEPKTVRLVGKLGVRSKNLDLRTSNRTQNLKTDYCREFREFKFYLTWICSGCSVWNHPKLQEFFAQIEYNCVFEYLNKCNSSFKWPEFHNSSRYTIFKLVAWQYIVYALMQMWRCFLPAKMSCSTYKRSMISTQYWLFLWNVRFRF